MEQGPVILIVDDEPDVGCYIAACLRRSGFSAIVAESGREALSHFRRAADQVALVLTDVVMSDLSGPQFVDAIRQLKSDIRVLYMSGYKREHLSRFGTDLVGYEVLSKPFTPAELLHAVKRAVGSTSSSVDVTPNPLKNNATNS